MQSMTWHDMPDNTMSFENIYMDELTAIKVDILLLS